MESERCVPTSTSKSRCVRPQNLDSTLLQDPDSVSKRALPRCKVCGDKSTGLHYGVISCEACKSFYRRSFKRKRKRRCATGKASCVVSSETKFCSYCRFQKCVATGMAKEAIKIGRYTHERKTRNTLEVKGETAPVDSNSEHLVNTECHNESMTNFHEISDVRSDENAPTISMDLLTLRCIEADVNVCERATVERIIQKLANASERLNPYYGITQNSDVIERKQTDYYEFCSLKNDVFGNLFNLSREEHEHFHQATGIDLDERDKKMSLELDDAWCCTMSMVDFAKLIPGFREIDYEDQASLLKGAFCDYWLICSVKYVHKEYLVETTPTGGVYLWGELAFLITKEYQRELKLFYQAATKLSLSNETWAIIKAMTLTFPDRTLMKRQERVERVQNTLIDCLQYSLGLNHERPQEILCKIIDLFLIMRNITELDYKYYQNNILRWPNIKRYPLIYEVLSQKID